LENGETLTKYVPPQGIPNEINGEIELQGLVKRDTVTYTKVVIGGPHFLPFLDVVRNVIERVMHYRKVELVVVGFGMDAFDTKLGDYKYLASAPVDVHFHVRVPKSETIWSHLNWPLDKELEVAPPCWVPWKNDQAAHFSVTVSPHINSGYGVMGPDNPAYKARFEPMTASFLAMEQALCSQWSRYTDDDEVYFDGKHWLNTGTTHVDRQKGLLKTRLPGYNLPLEDDAIVPVELNEGIPSPQNHG
jgi:hypothetical protein